MSVRTTFDEKVDSIRTHVSSVVNDLNEIVVDKCWGYEELSEEGKRKYKELFQQFLEIRDSLE